MKTRFLASWIPTKDVESVAQKKGWKPDDGTSFWDWMEPEFCEKMEEFATYESALAFARQKLPDDVFGNTRITKQESYFDTSTRQWQWESVTTWDVTDDSSQPDSWNHEGETQ